MTEPSPSFACTGGGTELGQLVLAFQDRSNHGWNCSTRHQCRRLRTGVRVRYR